MMNYKEMIENARKQGVASETAMFAGIASVDSLLAMVKSEHPDEYWKFMRQTHSDLYGYHYDECFADYDVKEMHSTDRNGNSYSGAHWSMDEIMSATQGKTFPSGTTRYDEYVAYNAMWHDLHKQFEDSDILEAAYLFYFADEDAPNGKVWKYMNAME